MSWSRLVAWLKHCGITTVALESTGVFWLALYQLLEDAGLRPCLVNARGMKNVPGRRTDWHDCQWLQYLLSVGLLRPAFRPEQAVCAVRSAWRQSAELVAMASQHVQHMQKALTQMNLQIHHVLSDITGVTGLAIEMRSSPESGIPPNWLCCANPMSGPMPKPFARRW
jgi:hypothetical protein